MKKKYIMIKEYLLEKIKNGEYDAGKAIPSERDLAAVFQVNRMTVRKAIEDLMYEGLLFRKKGSGTFLMKGKASKNAWKRPADAEEVNEVKIVSCKLGDESNYGYKALGIGQNKPYWRMRRVRLLNHVPYAYEDIYFNPDFFEKIVREDYKLGLRSLIDKYIKDHSATVYDEVEALLCLNNTAVLLKVETGSPILQIKSYFEQEGRVIMHCRSYHPGDSYKYQTEAAVL